MGLNPADDRFEAGLRTKLPAACFRPLDPHYLTEPRGLLHGQGGLLLTPATTEEVSIILRACNVARVGVVPYGGGTGLVGGQVCPDGPAPVILSLERMNRLRDLDSTDNIIVVEAGMVLADVQRAARERDRLFPLSLAAEGSCRIGGNLATNAGGVNVLRYGNARELCLGVEAVLPDGRVLHGLKRLRKDNTGYDLRNLLVGSEGTLGVITAAALRLFPRPAENIAAFLQIDSPAAALELLEMAQAAFGNMVSAFELIDRQGLEFLRETIPHLRQPFAQPGKWMVLVEIGAPRQMPVQTALEGLLAEAMEHGLVSDGLISQSEAQRQEFWRLRETIPEANRLIGAVSSHDISVPVSRIPDLVERGAGVVAAVDPALRINCFGHVGDGNLHYNVYPPKGKSVAAWRHLRGAVKQAVYGLAHDLGGSISAEHGIGRLKREDLARFADPARLQAMRAIKDALDPNGIMNPGAVL